MKTALSQFLAIALILMLTLAACSAVPVQPPAPPAQLPTTDAPIVLPDRPTQPPDSPVDNSTPSTGSDSGQPSPYAPQPGDEKLVRGNAFIDSAEILVLESYPEQYTLNLRGSLPNPCYKLRLSITAPQDGKVNIEAYSLTERGSICIEMLQPFEASLPLNSLPQGEHLILVNGEEVSSITIR